MELEFKPRSADAGANARVQHLFFLILRNKLPNFLRVYLTYNYNHKIEFTVLLYLLFPQKSPPLLLPPVHTVNSGTFLLFTILLAKANV